MPITQEEITAAIDSELDHMRATGQIISAESLHESLRQTYRAETPEYLAPVSRRSSAQILAICELQELHPHLPKF